MMKRQFKKDEKRIKKISKFDKNQFKKRQI